jgi:hypothetical protein
MLRYRETKKKNKKKSAWMEIGLWGLQDICILDNARGMGMGRWNVIMMEVDY